MKQAYVKGTNIRIDGTLEAVRGRAVVHGFDEQLQPVYTGQTDVWWDEQKTVTDYAGRPLYLDEEGSTRTVEEIEFRDE